MLFTNLPARCIVLLEDIDTAGLIRSEKSDEAEDKAEDSSKSSSESASEGWKMVDLAKALKKANKQTEEEAKKGISLSGLLNAIDGVASHEGRVLVMTTNKPEKLDDALIRPGRVDLQVAFGNATQIQIKELFERMYTSDLPRVRRVPNGTNVSQPAKQNGLPPMGKALTPTIPPTPSGTVLIPKQVVSPPSAARTFFSSEFGLPKRSLEACAVDFSSKVPDDKFSPAEIQGFLLKRKKQPQKACAEVERWVESMLELKGNKGKVLEVQ